VGEIGGHTRGVDHIVEGELVDERASLEEEGERLEVMLAFARTFATFVGDGVPDQCHR